MREKGLTTDRIANRSSHHQFWCAITLLIIRVIVAKITRIMSMMLNITTPFPRSGVPSGTSRAILVTRVCPGLWEEKRRGSKMYVDENEQQRDLTDLKIVWSACTGMYGVVSRHACLSLLNLQNQPPSG